MNNQQIDEAIKLLKQNEIIILPTDTIYGLSSIVNFENQIKINEIKKADINKPLIILISDVSDIQKFNIEVNEEIIELLSNDFPTTVIIENYSFRLVKRQDIKFIIKSIGPIFSTSVNIHNSKPLTNELDLKNFNSKIKLFWIGELDCAPSKIFNWNTKEWIR